MKKVIERWFKLLGYEVHIRAEPAEYRNDIKKLSSLVDKLNQERTEEAFQEANNFAEECTCRWGTQPDIIRLQTFASFERPFNET